MAEKRSTSGNRCLSFCAVLFLIFADFVSGQQISVEGRSGRGYLLDQGAIVRGPVERREIALIFSADFYADGFKYVLDELRRQGIKGSFFLTGNFLRQPEFKPLVERMIEEGHYLGPHSDRHLLYCDWKHREKTLVTREEFLSDLEGNYLELEKFGLSRDKARYFLPPYEWYNRQIVDWAAEAGTVVVNFTPGLITGADYTSPEMENYRSSEEILLQLLTYESGAPDGLNGFIILIHPGVAPERTDLFYFCLGELISELRRRGYQFVRIDRLLSDRAENTEGFESRNYELEIKKRELSVREPEDKKDRAELIRKKPGGERIPFALLRKKVEWFRGKMAGFAVSQDRVLVPVVSENELSCHLFDLSSGQKLASRRLPEVAEFTLVSGESGFWLTGAGRLLLVDRESGEISEKSLQMEQSPSVRPLEFQGRIILCFGKEIKAFDSATGKPSWEYEFPEEISGVAAMSGKGLFVALRSGQVINLDVENGRKISGFSPGQKLWGIFSDGKNIYPASAEGNLWRFDTVKQKIVWKFSAGQTIEHVVFSDRHLFVLTRGGVLYKLKASGGDIVWWQTIPGRTAGRPAIIGEEIIVPSGKILHGFDLKTGKKSSETVLSFDLRGDLAATGEYVLAGAYDFRQDLSLLYVLKKEPRLIIRSSSEWPQPVGRKIVFTVLTYGWKKPRFEFYLRQGEAEERLVKKASSDNSWTWLPVIPGEYTVIVRVYEGKVSGTAELRYNIISFAGEERK